MRTPKFNLQTILADHFWEALHVDTDQSLKRKTYLFCFQECYNCIWNEDQYLHLYNIWYFFFVLKVSLLLKITKEILNTTSFFYLYHFQYLIMSGISKILQCLADLCFSLFFDSFCCNFILNYFSYSISYHF